MINRRVLRACAVLGVCTVAAAACQETQLTPGFAADVTPPTIQIQKTRGDTIDVVNGVEFGVTAADNLGLKVVSINMAGGLNLQLDTIFTSAITSFARGVLITLPVNTTAGGMMLITATALDGADNPASAVDSIFLFNSEALIVTVLNPLSGALASAGKKLPVEVKASQRKGVRKAGYILGPSLAGSDSVFLFTSPLPDTLVFSDTLLIPDTAQAASFTITGFGEDTQGRRVLTPPLTVQIQSVQNDANPPFVSFSVAKRVEVDDSITVTATDPSGIIQMGWEARFLDGTIAGGDSATYDGTSTQVTQKWSLGFNFVGLPQSVVITAFAVDAAGNRGTSDQNPPPAPIVVSAASPSPVAPDGSTDARPEVARALHSDRRGAVRGAP